MFASTTLSPTGSPSPAELDKVMWLPLICSADYLIVENVSAMVPGSQLGPYHLTDLKYADDAAIFATNQNDI